MEFGTIVKDDAALVGLGIRALVAGAPGAGTERIEQRLAQVGAMVDTAGDVYSAMAEVIDDPSGYALLVIDADSMGGIEAVESALSRLAELRARVPVILLSRECSEQSFPNDRAKSIRLRNPLSAVSLRIALEHALRARVMWHMAA